MQPIKNCRLWMLAVVVIVLAAASSAASQVTKDTGGLFPPVLSAADKTRIAPPGASDQSLQKQLSI